MVSRVFCSSPASPMPAVEFGLCMQKGKMVSLRRPLIQRLATLRLQLSLTWEAGKGAQYASLLQENATGFSGAPNLAASAPHFCKQGPVKHLN